MILTVTLNAALDLTYDVDDVVAGTSVRVHRVRRRGGGKGVNVSSVLAAMSVDSVATGLVGGATGQQILAELDARSIRHHFVKIAGESRRTVNAVSRATGDATIFNEPGPVITDQDWQRFRRSLAALLGELNVTVVVAAGSLPLGAPADAYAHIVRAAHRHGAVCVLDADGGALVNALIAQPDVVKPNRRELSDATGQADPVLAARNLQDQGARTVVASDGAAGAVVVPPDGPVIRGRLSRPLRGNPTGAGDAMVAALATGLDDRAPWPHTLTRAIAWSAAAVLEPMAGHVDATAAAAFLPAITVETIRNDPSCMF